MSRSSRLCLYGRGAVVTIDVGAEGIAHVGGVHRCGSPWVCPVCAPVVREKRAQEIDRGTAGHLARGGGSVLVTLTVRHNQASKLAGRLDAVCQAFKLSLKGSGWDRRRERIGFVGLIRAVEVTWSEANGWHPHVHALMFLERPIGEAEAADLQKWLLGRWDAVCRRRGFGSLNAVHGVDVRVVREASGVAGYLAKVEQGWGVGQELARGDVKVGRGHGLVPVEVFDQLMETGEKRWLDLWLEYEKATFGKRAIVWSAGLRARLLGSEDELSDVELAAGEGPGEVWLRVLVPSAMWQQLLLDGGAVGILEIAEFVVLLVRLGGGVRAGPPSGGRPALVRLDCL